MSYEEKNTWLFGIIAIAGYSVYLGLLLPQAAQTPFPETPYVVPMLGTIGGAILSGILSGIVLGILSPRDAGKKDQRDREIDRFGERVGSAFLIIGALGALVLAMFEAHTFWIANALYLGFVLSGILSTIAKVVAYRRGFQW